MATGCWPPVFPAMPPTGSPPPTPTTPTATSPRCRTCPLWTGMWRTASCTRTSAALSYEEYHPYGTTSYRSATSAAQVSLKRYRFTGKEKDTETGFYYHGARYCAPWLGRWISADPAGFVDGVNIYAYCRNNPIS